MQLRVKPDARNSARATSTSLRRTPANRKAPLRACRCGARAFVALLAPLTAHWMCEQSLVHRARLVLLREARYADDIVAIVVVPSLRKIRIASPAAGAGAVAAPLQPRLSDLPAVKSDPKHERLSSRWTTEQCD